MTNQTVKKIVRIREQLDKLTTELYDEGEREVVFAVQAAQRELQNPVIDLALEAD